VKNWRTGWRRSIDRLWVLARQLLYLISTRPARSSFRLRPTAGFKYSRNQVELNNFRRLLKVMAVADAKFMITAWMIIGVSIGFLIAGILAAVDAIPVFHAA
jgi:hypothetical protein